MEEARADQDPDAPDGGGGGSGARTDTDSDTDTGTGGAFDRLAGGRFGRLVLPAVILQSVLIGGGYASGREVVEFGARFGPDGGWAIAAIFAGFTVVNVLVFEVARKARTYDYKSFMRALIGRGWPVFDVVFAAMAVLIIAVMASATGEILEATVGVPALLGIGAAVAGVGVLTYHGAGLLERFKTGGTLLLYAGYAVFAGMVLWTLWPQVIATLQAGAAGAAGAVGAGSAGAAGTSEASPATVVGTGVLYVGYNLAVYPAVLFTLHRQTTRRDTVVAGVVAGVLMTLPFLWTFLAVMAFYPDPAVLAAPVPWLAMLDALGTPWIVVVYGVVVGWTLLETSTGLIHAILDRVDRDLETLDGVPSAVAGGFTPLQRGAAGAGILVGAALLAQVGIFDLVAWGYTAMAFAFLAIFAVPLLTVGVKRLLEPPVVVLAEIPEGVGGQDARDAPDA